MTETTATPTTRPSNSGRSLLRVALDLDAAVTGANGLAYLVAAGPLADLFGLDAAFLRGIGAFLVAFAVLVAFTGTRERISRPAVHAVVAANLAWAAASAVMAIAGLGSPEAAGTVWIAMQAFVVAAFADLQMLGLRRG